MWLRCLNNEEACKVMGEVHEGLCGAHQSGPKMKVRIKRLGYYWPTMIRDYVVGPIDPPSSKGHRFILVATDYFSKLAEAIPLKEVKSEDVMRFFRDHVVCCFGVPCRIISDNGPSFRSTKISRFARRHNINWRTTYRTPTQCTPYALAFGVEAVLPLEVELPSLRVAISHNLSHEDNARLRLEELDGLEELRLQAH
ncbi:uncharacterized protein LOC110112413 [Dendrobium catenatum]|uniref:3-deoxy-7-phosphoheptulonate synthase-like protein n=1 Tax=Dendrobium nobile TaxID=94219 RepID=A0A7T0FXQ3_DENNO|nr:uncharacterized protein LOC110112413 [Dendrobium catenatum]QPJ58207.1 3-deoxy-7-phosphoheptulonate synthase-like protein [Dendrobium nobile]